MKKLKYVWFAIKWVFTHQDVYDCRKESKYKGFLKRERLCRAGEYDAERTAYYRAKLEKNEEMYMRVMQALEEEEKQKAKAKSTALKYEQMTITLD